LFKCFGIKTGSLAANDLGGNKKLEDYVGHTEQNKNRSITFPKGSIPIIKTHKWNLDKNRSIYLIRDGRASLISLWYFYGQRIPVKDFILGNTKFGKWKDHLNSWNPLKRPDTLLIKYEDMVNDFESVLSPISIFIEKDIISRKIPSREKIALCDGRWVRTKTDWKDKISSEDLNLFNEINYHTLKEFGYE
tara:strand:- start:593 stop:1165 length:573 start_codon:yes stop_codon:yes gene_type:complete